jgi:hypothetical protein
LEEIEAGTFLILTPHERSHLHFISGFIPVKILIKRASEFVEKLGAIIVKLPRKIAEYKNQMEKQSVP